MNRLKRRRQRDRERGQMVLPFMQETMQLSFYLLPCWQEAATREGYERIEEAIVGIYRETGSMAETARRLTFSRRTISYKLEQLAEPVNGPGGANNAWGRGGKPEEVNV